MTRLQLMHCLLLQPGVRPDRRNTAARSRTPAALSPSLGLRNSGSTKKSSSDNTPGHHLSWCPILNLEPLSCLPNGLQEMTNSLTVNHKYTCLSPFRPDRLFSSLLIQVRNALCSKDRYWKAVIPSRTSDLSLLWPCHSRLPANLSPSQHLFKKAE